jgi:hypothetical protein
LDESLNIESKLKVRIYSIEYRLSSKTNHITQYPVQHRTLFTAWQKLLEWGIPPGKIVLGDSSNSFKFLKCLEIIVDENIPLPEGLLLDSPVVDLWVPENKDDEKAHFEEQTRSKRKAKKTMLV